MGADGTWNMTMKTPMGEQAGTLTLTTDGGTLTGTMGGPQGTMELENGTVDGDNLAWTVNMTSPMPITIEATATVDGDAIRARPSWVLSELRRSAALGPDTPTVWPSRPTPSRVRSAGGWLLPTSHPA